MKLIVIGDVHGRSSWKNLIDHSALNVFVGDYFDPYDDISFEDLKQNFLDIIKFKIQYPENVVLLYGNHDYHYFYKGDRSTRYDYMHAGDIMHLFTEFAHLFYGVAYSPSDNYLISHAGLTKEWADKYLKDINSESPVKTIESAINNLWESDKLPFAFEPNYWPGDCYGTSPTHSPIWVRDETLYRHAFNMNLSWIQIMGHTQHIDIIKTGRVTENLIFVDCLGETEKSFETFI